MYYHARFDHSFTISLAINVSKKKEAKDEFTPSIDYTIRVNG